MLCRTPGSVARFCPPAGEFPLRVQGHGGDTSTPAPGPVSDHMIAVTRPDNRQTRLVRLLLTVRESGEVTRRREVPMPHSQGPSPAMKRNLEELLDHARTTNLRGVSISSLAAKPVLCLAVRSRQESGFECHAHAGGTPAAGEGRATFEAPRLRHQRWVAIGFNRCPEIDHSRRRGVRVGRAIPHITVAAPTATDYGRGAGD